MHRHRTAAEAEEEAMDHVDSSLSQGLGVRRIAGDAPNETLPAMDSNTNTNAIAFNSQEIETNSISSASSMANSNLNIVNNNGSSTMLAQDMDRMGNGVGNATLGNINRIRLPMALPSDGVNYDSTDVDMDGDDDDDDDDNDDNNNNNTTNHPRRQDPGEDQDQDQDQDLDPDTDDEQHARSQMLRKRARTNSVSIPNNSLLRHYSTNVGQQIHVLPPEMLCLIFSYVHSKKDLLSIALTCKYWADLIISMVWFRPGINNKSIFHKLETVMKMDQSQTVWDYRKFIKRLNLSLIPSMVNGPFLELFVGCTNLERVTLVNCNKLTSASITKLLENCKRLQSIDLTGVSSIQDDIYMQLAKHCKRLQGLYAPGSANISKTAVLELITNCPLLKRVKFSDCNNIDDEVIDVLVQSCPSLVELDIHGCEQITNESLYKIFSQLECLKEFKISKNSNITYECLESSVHGSIVSLDRLRILDFTQCSNITDKAIVKLMKLAPKLRNVVLSKCSSITDISLSAIATLSKNLHYIHLGHCSNITDVGAKELIKSCYRLQYIDLACCNQLTNETIVELSRLPKLRRIGLVKCNQITDEGILALADNAKNSEDTLERIHLSYCVNLTIYPISRLLRACPKLTHISLTGISQFLRPDITQFCREPPSEFNPHQKSIFCVFSGEGVKLLKDHLIHIIQTTEVEDREAMEIEQIVAGIISTSTPTNIEIIRRGVANDRFNHFLNTAREFIQDYEDIHITDEQLELFARCIFGGIQQTQATRIQRFFQLMHDRPARSRARARARLLQARQEEAIERRRRLAIQGVGPLETLTPEEIAFLNELPANRDNRDATMNGLRRLLQMNRRAAQIQLGQTVQQPFETDERQMARVPNGGNLFTGVDDGFTGRTNANVDANGAANGDGNINGGGGGEGEDEVMDEPMDD